MSDYNHFQAFPTNAPLSPTVSSSRWSPNRLRKRSVEAIQNLSARVIKRTKSTLFDVPQRSALSNKQLTSSTNDHRSQQISRARSFPNIRPTPTVTTVPSQVTRGGTCSMMFPEHPKENIRADQYPGFGHGVQLGSSVESRSSDSLFPEKIPQDHDADVRGSEDTESAIVVHRKCHVYGDATDSWWTKAGRPPSRNDWRLDADADDDFWESIRESGDDSNIVQEVPASSEEISQLLAHVEACQDDTETVLVLSDLDMDRINFHSPSAELHVQSPVNHGDNCYSCSPSPHANHSSSTPATCASVLLHQGCDSYAAQLGDAYINEKKESLHSCRTFPPTSAENIHPLDDDVGGFKGHFIFISGLALSRVRLRPCRWTRVGGTGKPSSSPKPNSSCWSRRMFHLGPYMSLSTIFTSSFSAFLDHLQNAMTFLS